LGRGKNQKARFIDEELAAASIVHKASLVAVGRFDRGAQLLLTNEGPNVRLCMGGKPSKGRERKGESPRTWRSRGRARNQAHEADFQG